MVASPAGPSSTGQNAPCELDKPRLGQVLGQRWTLEAVVGVGGMSTVYRGRHRDGRVAAIKVLHESLARSPRVRARFLAEEAASTRVRHAGVVAVLDRGGSEDEVPFLALELLDGQSLAERWRAGPIEPGEVAAIAVRVLEILAHVHDQCVVHRDIKPANIFLCADGQVKLLDFGIAKAPREPSNDFHTGEGAVLGTPEFMAPEQAGGSDREVDARSDLFAVGATMFYCLTRRTVHEVRSSNEALVAAATRSAPRLSSTRTDLPAALVTVVDRALAFDLEQRWPNARAMVHDLLALLPADERSSLGAFDTSPTLPESSPASVASAVPRRRTRVTPPIALLATGGLLAVALVVSATSRRQAAPSAPATEAPVVMSAPVAVTTTAVPGEPATAPVPTVVASAPSAPVASVALSSRASSSPQWPALPARRAAPRPSPPAPDSLDDLLERRK